MAHGFEEEDTIAMAIFFHCHRVMAHEALVVGILPTVRSARNTCDDETHCLEESLSRSASVLGVSNAAVHSEVEEVDGLDHAPVDGLVVDRVLELIPACLAERPEDDIAAIRQAI